MTSTEPRCPTCNAIRPVEQLLFAMRDDVRRMGDWASGGPPSLALSMCRCGPRSRSALAWRSVSGSVVAAIYSILIIVLALLVGIVR